MSTPSDGAAAGDTGHDAATAVDTATLTLQDLENTSRNSKKKLYWSAFEAVLSTTRVDPATQREELTETRLDAYHVNHHQLKKLHGSSRAGSSTAVRVECKLCSTPRFTQSITVSTKKFEEHYMTHHALNALATAEKSKHSSAENDLQDGESNRNISAEKESSAVEDKNKNSSEPENVLPTSKTDANVQHSDATADPSQREEQIEIQTVDESHDGDGDGDGGGNAAAAGSSSPAARDGASREAAAVAVVALSSAPGPSRSKWTDPAESDTKRAKKSYWTAYEVVISERVARDGGVQVQETRQDAWRVNHNALRRLHLDERNQTTVRVECRLCTSPKYTQSITVSTKKFELHVQEEHADDVAANHAAGVDDTDSHGHNSASEAAARPIKKRRKSWRLMLQDHQQQLQRPQPLDAPSPKKPRVVIADSAPVPTSAAQAATPLFTPPSLQPVPISATAVLRWLVQDCLPLSFVDSPAFHAMMRVPYSSKALQVQLDAQFEQAKLQIQQVVRDERAASTRFSLSLEQFSTHSGLSALAISVHFVSSQWQSPRHLLVACRQVPTPVQSNVEAVKAVLVGVLEELGLTSVIEAVTTANDELNEVLDAIWPQPTERRSRRVTPVLPARLRCAGSALFSVVQAGLDSIASTAAPHTSAKRWTSSLDSLSVTASGSDTSSPTQQMAAAAMLVVTPFLRAATDLSDASFPSAAMVVTLFRHLRQSLEELVGDPDDVVAAQTKALARAMGDALLAVYDRVVSTEALLACVLDPRIRYSNVDAATKATVNSYMEARMREELKRGLDHDDCSQDSVMADASASSDGSLAPVTATSASSLLDSKPTLFEELLTKSEEQATSAAIASPAQNSGSTSPSSAENLSVSTDDRRSSLTGSSDVSLLIIRREIDAYLLLKNEPFGTDVIAWWQQHAATFPLLSRLARHVLGAVSSAQRCEQLFTVAGEERSARRRAFESIPLLEQLLISREWPSRETPSAVAAPDTIACVV